MPELIPVTAVRNGGLDFMEVPTQRERIIASLLSERAAYAKAGNAAEVANVNAELEHYGYRPENEE